MEMMFSFISEKNFKFSKVKIEMLVMENRENKFCFNFLGNCL